MRTRLFGRGRGWPNRQEKMKSSNDAPIRARIVSVTSKPMRRAQESLIARLTWHSAMRGEAPLTLSPRGLPGRSNHVASRDCPPFPAISCLQPVHGELTDDQPRGEPDDSCQCEADQPSNRLNDECRPLPRRATPHDIYIVWPSGSQIATSFNEVLKKVTRPYRRLLK